MLMKKLKARYTTRRCVRYGLERNGKKFGAYQSQLPHVCTHCTGKKVAEGKRRIVIECSGGGSSTGEAEEKERERKKDVKAWANRYRPGRVALFLRTGSLNR